MKKVIPVLILFSLIFISCEEKGPLKDYKKITPVFGYRILSDMKSGTQPGKGVLMIANAIIKTEQDSAVSEPNMGGGFIFEVPLRKPMGGSDLMKGFHKLSEGDSAVFVMLADTFFSKNNFNVKMPANVKSGSYVKLYLQVTELIDSLEYITYLEEKEVEDKVIAQQMFVAYLETVGIPNEPDVNGIVKSIDKKGKGPHPIFGQTVTLHYIELTLDGREITNTYMQGEPFEYILGDGNIIDGLNFSIMNMQKGEKARLVIPYYLAYGDAGNNVVPPYSNIVIDMELIDFK